MSGWMNYKNWIKIDGKNINNLRYADVTTLMTESEELESLLMSAKEEKENLTWSSALTN